MQRKAAIESEFDEPLRDVIHGFSLMGYSMPFVAEVLEVSTSSVKHYCADRQIRFEKVIERRAVSPGRPARLVTYSGRSQTVKAWADQIGITPRALRKRIARGIPLR